MTTEQYDQIAGELLAAASRIETEKRPGYTQGNEDCFRNFKEVAKRTGSQPFQVLLTYLLKHIDSICSSANKNIHQAEPMKERFADAINYLKLGYALQEEERMEALAEEKKKLLSSDYVIKPRAGLEESKKKLIEKYLDEGHFDRATEAVDVFKGNDSGILKYIPNKDAQLVENPFPLSEKEFKKLVKESN